MSQPELQLPLPGPERGYCEGRQDRCTGDVCPIYGVLTRASRDGKRRVRGCDDPVARGRRNKSKGQRKQSKAVTMLGIPRSSIRPGHEEFLGGTVRVEVKAGGKAKTVDTAYRNSRTQSDAARGVGDHRPFAALFMPDGSSDGYAVVRLSDLQDFVYACVELWGVA